MDRKTVAALSETLSPHVDLGNARRETRSLLTLGTLSARTTNLSVPASERSAAAGSASTCRPLRRFFRHADPGENWAAPVATGLAGHEGPRTPIIDRTNRKVGRREINLLVLAVATPAATGRADVDRAGPVGDSGAPERTDLMERYIARFGKTSVGLLPADREFIGTDWSDRLTLNDIPFAIRLRGTRRATLPLDAMAADGAPGPALSVRAKRPRGREPVIVANRPKLDALATHRKRRAVECLFADVK